jgi:hypothetical protein
MLGSRLGDQELALILYLIQNGFNSSFDFPVSKSNDTQNLSCAKTIVITALAELGASRSFLLKPIQR